jgi:putative transposase
MRPAREQFRNTETAYSVSTQTAARKPFFRHERWARLMMATLTHYSQHGFLLHAYVIMPDHLHLLITPEESLEKAVQLIKGGFSFRAKRELEWIFDIWQPGFTDHRVRDEEDWQRHLEYIRTNPLEARIVEDSVLYEFMGFPNAAFPQGLKPQDLIWDNVRAKARTLHQNTEAELRSNPAQPEPKPSEGNVKGTSFGPSLETDPSIAALAREATKGTGFSPYVKANSRRGSLAQEGGKR